jgi:hypothetical protein
MANVFRQNLQAGLQLASLTVAQSLGDQYHIIHRGVDLGLYWGIPSDETTDLEVSLDGSSITTEVTLKKFVFAAGQTSSTSQPFPDIISQLDGVLDPNTNCLWQVTLSKLDSVSAQYRVETKRYTATRMGQS